MLLDFQVENFRSYYQPRRFSLVASRLEELSANVMEAKELDLRVLRSAALYGANASGKSNLFEAIWCLGDLIREGPDLLRSDGRARMAVFALNPTAAQEATRFEINFLTTNHQGVKGTRYEYRLSVRHGQVVEEWLNVYPDGGKRQRWFVREATDSVPASITFSKSLVGAHKSLKRVTPPEMPFLFAAKRFGHEQLSVPAGWLQENCINLFKIHWSTTAEQCYQDPAFVDWVSKFMTHADLGIQGVKIDKRKPPQEHLVASMPPMLREAFRRLIEYDVTFLHQTSSGGPVPLPLSVESQGTQRLFELLGPLALALRAGRLVLVDEMSASMHPLLTQRLIETFHDSRINSRDSQLLLTAQDVSLLRGDLFRRDQVWFTEKTPAGETDLYSLHAFQPRTDASLEKNYLAGRYGAIPYLGKFDFGMVNGSSKETRQEARKPTTRS